MFTSFCTGLSCCWKCRKKICDYFDYLRLLRLLLLLLLLLRLRLLLLLRHYDDDDCYDHSDQILRLLPPTLRIRPLWLRLLRLPVCGRGRKQGRRRGTLTENTATIGIRISIKSQIEHCCVCNFHRRHEQRQNHRSRHHPSPDPSSHHY